MTQFRHAIQADRRGIPEKDGHIRGMQGPVAAFDWLMKIERQRQARIEAVASFGPEEDIPASTALQGLRRRLIEHSTPAPDVLFEATA